METWKYHTLKRVELDAHTVIGIPEDWSFGYDKDKDRFWCGREDDDVTLFVQRVVSEPKERDAGRAVARSVASIVKFLNEVDGLQGKPELAVRNSEETCVHAVVDHLEDGVSFRTFRWFFFRLVDSQTLAEVRFVLSMPAALSDEPAHRELVEIFAEQMGSVKTGDPLEDPLWARVQEWRRLSETDRTGCRFDWHRLRIVKPFGFIRMLAPEGWPINQWDAEAGMWCLCDEPEDEVTLWIDYRLQDGISADRFDALAADIERRWPADIRNRGRLHLDGGGFLLRATKMAEENGEMLRYFHWTAVAPISRGVMFVSFGLVISATSQDTADEALLVRIFDEEVPRFEFREPPARKPA